MRKEGSPAAQVRIKAIRSPRSTRPALLGLRQIISMRTAETQLQVA